ncbi:MAG TPA: glycosyltransferase family 4 protein, partial [Candidatus Latescibacteria bacterium]|nr:glycosyltransferase family 4 protein [Candidatus Latescibacterota bacterium]
MTTDHPTYDVCLLTTGYPRFEGDLFGAFVLELARGLVRQGLRVAVLAPHDRGASLREDVDGVRIQRFRYFIPRWQRLAYGGGMPTNLRESWIAR